MSIRLSPRLRALADLVPEGARVVDVGTDHARIPVWLAQTERASHIWASDLRPGPLKSAAALIAGAGVGNTVDIRRTDGLHGFGPEDADTVIIAGMGGETMVAILSAAEWVREGVLLILGPQSKQDFLRNYLIQNGFSIVREALVKDGGRIYPILLAQGGNAGIHYTQAELHTGAFCQISADPLFAEYLAGLIKRAETAAPHDPAADVLLWEFRSMEVRLQKS